MTNNRVLQSDDNVFDSAHVECLCGYPIGAKVPRSTIMSTSTLLSIDAGIDEREQSVLDCIQSVQRQAFVQAPDLPRLEGATGGHVHVYPLCTSPTVKRLPLSEAQDAIELGYLANTFQAAPVASAYVHNLCGKPVENYVENPVRGSEGGISKTPKGSEIGGSVGEVFPPWGSRESLRGERGSVNGR